MFGKFTKWPTRDQLFSTVVDVRTPSNEAFLIHSGSGSHKVDIAAGEEVEVSVWTRSKAGGMWSIKDDDKNVLVNDTEAKHSGGDDHTVNPTQTVLTKTKIKGPCALKVHVASNGGRFTSERFLVAFCIY